MILTETRLYAVSVYKKPVEVEFTIAKLEIGYKRLGIIWRNILACSRPLLCLVSAHMDNKKSYCPEKIAL